MLKICRLAVLLLLLLVVVITPKVVGAAIVTKCQNQVAVVFGNGMFTNREDAEFYRQVVEQELTTRLRNKLNHAGNPILSYIKMDYLAYASDKDGLGSSFTDQLLEVYYQKLASLSVSFWRTLAGIGPSQQWFQDAMVNLAGAQTAMTYTVDADYQKMMSQYRLLLNQGKNIVIVTHSQGGFYGKAVYDALNADFPIYQHFIQMHQVATPVPVLGASGWSFVNLSEDAIIAPITPLVNTGNYANLTELGALAWVSATFGHSFVKWHLKGTYSKNMNLNFIQGQVDYAHHRYTSASTGCIQYTLPGR